MTSQHHGTAWSVPSIEGADREDGLPGVAHMQRMILAAPIAAQITVADMGPADGHRNLSRSRETARRPRCSPTTKPLGASR